MNTPPLKRDRPPCPDCGHGTTIHLISQVPLRYRCYASSRLGNGCGRVYPAVPKPPAKTAAEHSKQMRDRHYLKAGQVPPVGDQRLIDYGNPPRCPDCGKLLDSKGRWLLCKVSKGGCGFHGEKQYLAGQKCDG
jgi:hypothetical protein